MALSLLAPCPWRASKGDPWLRQTRVSRAFLALQRVVPILAKHERPPLPGLPRPPCRRPYTPKSNPFGHPHYAAAWPVLPRFLRRLQQKDARKLLKTP